MAAGLAQVKAEGWRQLRINQIAKEIGVSRPTIYAEFGTKEEFTATLIERELDVVFQKFQKALTSAHGKPHGVLTKGFKDLISDSAQSPLISGLLADDDSEQLGHPATPVHADGLLPFINRCSELLIDWIEQHQSGLKPSEVAHTADALARLVLSHVMTPTSDPAHASKELAKLATRLIPGI